MGIFEAQIRDSAYSLALSPMAASPVVAAHTHNGIEKYYPDKGILAKHPSKPHLSGMDEYEKLYQESITKPDQFWGGLARELLT